MTDAAKHIDQGGPAFPEIGNVAYNSDWQNESGMSLRDYFAGKALMSFGTWMPMGFSNLNGDDALAARASLAYRQADAMIAARKAGA